MDPIIRNVKDVFSPEGSPGRLVTLDDNPPTCTMTYSEIKPGETSSHHIHPWEHEIYIIEGLWHAGVRRQQLPGQRGRRHLHSG